MIISLRATATGASCGCNTCKSAPDLHADSCWMHRWFLRVPDAVAARLRKEDAAFSADEEKAVRYRLTESRLKKATPAGGVWDAVLIGGGPGSLGAAAALARMGWKCAVFEQGEQLGGGAHVFSEAGYEFETGVHYLGNDRDMASLLDFLSCGRLELASIGTPLGDGKVMYDAIRIAGKEYQFCAGRDNLIGMLRERFPDKESLALISRFEQRLKHHMSQEYKMSATMFFRLKVPTILQHPWLGWLRRLLQTKIMGRHYYRSTQQTSEEMLRELGVTPSSELGAVLLGQYGDAGMRPDKCSAMMHMGVMAHYCEGSVYPVGGSGAIPRKLNSVVLAAGGRSFVQARVQSLLVQPDGSCGGVRVNDMEVHAKVTISSAGALRSYRDLLGPIPAMRPLADAAVERIRATTELSVAFIFLFVGLDIPEDSDAHKDRRSHNTWIYPRPDYTQMEKEIDEAEPWSVPMPMFVASGSAKDVAWANKHGARKKTVVVLSQCPFSWVKPWAGMTHSERSKDASYQKFKADAREAMMQQGFREIFPDLERYIVHTSVGTPLSTNNFLSTEEGECYGRSATPTRWLCPDLSPYTPMKNFYLTGQDVVTLGLTGGIAAGYMTANVVAGYGSWENLFLQREICADLGLKPLF